MTQPTLLSLETPSRLKMPTKQPGGGGEFRSMLERDPVAREMPKQNDAGSDEGLGRASVRTQIAFEVARPGKRDEANEGQISDDQLAEEESDDEATAGTAVGELRILLGDTGKPGHASTENRTSDGTGAAPDAKLEQPQSGVGVAEPADDEGGRNADEALSAFPGTDKADRKRPAAESRAAVDLPAGRAAERVATQAAAEGRDTPKPWQIAASDGTGADGDRIAPAAGGKGSSETRQDGAGQREGKGEGKSLLAGAAVVAENPGNPQSASQPAARTVVTTLGADPSWTAYFRVKPTPAQATPQALTVQLRPAELGIVSAHLSFNGDSLTVELRPETQEAHRQLARDTDAIARSLRAIGLEVDQVTVQPASPAQDGGRGALNARSDGQGGAQQGQGQAFASPEGQGERGGGRQQASGNPFGFGGRSGSDEIRGGAGGGDRDGRYI